MTQRTIRDFCQKKAIRENEFKESLERVRRVAHIEIDSYTNGTVEGYVHFARAIMDLTKKLNQKPSLDEPTYKPQKKG